MKKIITIFLAAMAIGYYVSYSKTEPVQVVSGEVTVSEEKERIPTGIRVDATFTQEFIDNYQYEDAKNYGFALKIDGNYYNVFRNENNGVSNSIPDGLNGLVPAYQFKNIYTWYIPFGKIKVANSQNKYGYKIIDFKQKDQYEFSLSPVKEGVDTHDIGWGFTY